VDQVLRAIEAGESNKIEKALFAFIFGDDNPFP